MTLVGKHAPHFVEDAAFNDLFETIDLNNYRGKWVVLFFYPLDFTFVCPTEITAMSDAYDEFARRDTMVIGVSTDSKYSHNMWVNIPRHEGGIGKLKYPLVADFTKKISAAYGVLLPEGMALRSTFIIDPEGVVRFALVHDNGIGRSVKEILRSVDALQFNRAHGEVCPAGWEPGGDTIVPDINKSKQFFNKIKD